MRHTTPINPTTQALRTVFQAGAVLALAFALVALALIVAAALVTLVISAAALALPYAVALATSAPGMVALSATAAFASGYTFRGRETDAIAALRSILPCPSPALVLCPVAERLDVYASADRAAHAALPIAAPATLSEALSVATLPTDVYADDDVEHVAPLPIVYPVESTPAPAKAPRARKAPSPRKAASKPTKAAPAPSPVPMPTAAQTTAETLYVKRGDKYRPLAEAKAKAGETRYRKVGRKYQPV